MEPLFFIIVLILFWALPALLKRYRAREAQEEAEERPEHRASLNEVRRFLRDLGLEEGERPEVPLCAARRRRRKDLLPRSRPNPLCLKKAVSPEGRLAD